MISILKGEKVYLKPLEEQDIDKRTEWINDEEIQATLNYDYPAAYSKGKYWYQKAVMDQSRRDFSVFTASDDKHIGFCGLINIEDRIRKAELYAVIGEKDYWKGGYGTETYGILMRFGFLELGLEKIYGYQLVHNMGAHRVVEKLGWKRDGLLRKDLFSHGKLVDRYVVSILREEWFERNQQDVL